jgi:hypothetical protein
MAMNVRRALNRYGMPFVQQMIDKAAAAGEKRYITIEHVNDIANDAISGNLGRLRQEQALTGEWLMFAEYKGQRFYLWLERFCGHRCWAGTIHAQASFSVAAPLALCRSVSFRLATTIAC